MYYVIKECVEFFLLFIDAKYVFFYKGNATISQDRQTDAWADKPSLHSASQTSIVADIPLSNKRDSFYADRESQLESFISSSSMSLYGQDSSLSGLRSSALSRATPPIVTTVSSFKHSYFIYVLFHMKHPWKCEKYHILLCFGSIFTTFLKNNHIS